LVIPQTITLNVQSGIAEDTLLFGSIHQADWDNAQISIPANAATGAIAIGSSFTSKTAYSVGLGRKISDDLSLIASYSTEDGGGSTSTDPFTLTDGYQTLGVAARYTRDNMTFTAGYGYTKVGDVDVTLDMTALGGAVLTAGYDDNDISAIGLKIGFSF
jgi:long-subunit fatty acid transport protein